MRAMADDARAIAVDAGDVTERPVPEPEPPPGLDLRDSRERSRSPYRYPTYHRNREIHMHNGRMEVRLSAMLQEIDDLKKLCRDQQNKYEHCNNKLNQAIGAIRMAWPNLGKNVQAPDTY